jgi:hypothetical protein
VIEGTGAFNIAYGRWPAQKNVGSQDILIKEAQKDQMFVSVEKITVFE